MGKSTVLFTSEGVTLAAFRMDGAADRPVEAALRDGARMYGFSEEEVRGAKVVIEGTSRPAQPARVGQERHQNDGER